MVVNFSSWEYEGGNGLIPKKLGESLGLHPRTCEYTQLGGNIPQVNTLLPLHNGSKPQTQKTQKSKNPELELPTTKSKTSPPSNTRNSQKKISEACLALERGEAQGVLITGAETLHSVGRMGQKSQGERAAWPKGEFGRPDINLDNLEADYTLILPSRAYALIETSIRASLGRSPKEHEKQMGNLMAKFSAVSSSTVLSHFSWSLGDSLPSFSLLSWRWLPKTPMPGLKEKVFPRRRSPPPLQGTDASTTLTQSSWMHFPVLIKVLLWFWPPRRWPSYVEFPKRNGYTPWEVPFSPRLNRSGNFPLQ